MHTLALDARDFQARISMVIEGGTVEGISRKPSKILGNSIRCVCMELASIQYPRCASRYLRRAAAFAFMETTSITSNSQPPELKLYGSLRGRGDSQWCWWRNNESYGNVWWWGQGGGILVASRAFQRQDTGTVVEIHSFSSQIFVNTRSRKLSLKLEFLSHERKIITY